MVADPVTTVPMSLRVALVSSFLAAVLVGVLNVGFTIYQQRQADRRWCDLFTTLSAPEKPPSTERGRIVQDRIGDMAEKLRCGRQ